MIRRCRILARHERRAASELAMPFHVLQQPPSLSPPPPPPITIITAADTTATNLAKLEQDRMTSAAVWRDIRGEPPGGELLSHPISKLQGLTTAKYSHVLARACYPETSCCPVNNKLVPSQ
ncbi:hypothetical protein C0Q70_05996 [Pomacea canaliculata]|uniref:Uncharacterized protein n=1 Tax=Pomacea canaliculata TaxID=400727 RepID=A0A2T7PMS7_POMCA|nr:hypothetical protein C0Q70_05996 [Pomacea canaliculata]